MNFLFCAIININSDLQLINYTENLHIRKFLPKKYKKQQLIYNYSTKLHFLVSQGINHNFFDRFKQSSLGVSDINCDFPGTGALCEYIPEGSKYGLRDVTKMPELEGTTGNPCEPGWAYSEGYCYNTIQNDKISWLEANYLCGQLGAFSASLETGSELVSNYFLKLYDLKK